MPWERQAPHQVPLLTKECSGSPAFHSCKHSAVTGECPVTSGVGVVPAADGGWAFTALACPTDIHHILSYLPYPAVPLSLGPLACLSPPSTLTLLGNTWSVLPSFQGRIHPYINYLYPSHKCSPWRCWQTLICRWPRDTEGDRAQMN